MSPDKRLRRGKISDSDGLASAPASPGTHVIIDLGVIDFDRTFPGGNNLELSEDEVVRVADVLSGTFGAMRQGPNRHIYSDYHVEAAAGRLNFQVKKGHDGLPSKTSLHLSSHKSLSMGINMHDLSDVSFAEDGITFRMHSTDGIDILSVLRDGRISFQHEPPSVNIIDSTAISVTEPREAQ